MVSVDDTEMRAVLDRLTRLEERGVSRAQIVDAQLSHVNKDMADLKAGIATLVTTVTALSDEVKAAKVGLRVGMAIMTGLGGFAGWVISHMPFGK